MLSTLLIKNFRSLENFEVNKLGRLNLIVGKNNSGKSTVLEALRIYAGNAQLALLEEIAAGHDEKYRFAESEQAEEGQEFPFEHFFSGRVFPEDDSGAIRIGESLDSPGLLKINNAYYVETEEDITGENGETYTRTRRKIYSKSELLEGTEGEIKQAIVVSKNDKMRLFDMDKQFTGRRTRSISSETGEILPCSFVSTQFNQFNTFDELADIWDKVQFTEFGNTVRNALKIISGDCENIAFVKNDVRSPMGISPYRQELRRTAKIKLEGSYRAVPLSSMGDGMLRILQLILKVVPAKGGFLLIDEFENGLHFSVQEKTWALLFELAEQLDIQVFATTHSWDCIESFAKVAKDKTDIEGVLFRVGQSIRTSEKGRTIATIFDEEKLANITQADVEVR